MTDHTELEFDVVAAGFMADGPSQLADDVIDAVLLEIHGLGQRRRRGALRWKDRDPRSWAALAAAIAIVGVGIAGVVGVALPRFSTPAGPPPTAVPGGVEQPTSTHENLRMIAPYPGDLLPGTISFTFDDRDNSGRTTWLMDPSGARPARLHVLAGWPSGTPTSQFDCCGVFSPDRRIAMGYAETNELRGPGSWQTGWIMNFDGTEDGPFPPFCGGCGSLRGIHYVPRAWSSDGSQIAAETWSDADPGMSGIKLSPTRAGNWNQATIGRRDVPIAYSPDGARLLFVRIDDSRDPDDPAGPLMVLDVATAETRVISQDGLTVDARRDVGPQASWSPDGSLIAFAAMDAEGLAGVYVVDATSDGSVAPAGPRNPVAIAGPRSGINGAAWSPDGNWIAYVGPSAGVTPGADGAGLDVVVIHPDGTGERDLTPDLGHLVRSVAWSPDSSHLVASVHTSGPLGNQLVVVSLNGDPVRQITVTSGTYTDVSWAPATR
jgi:Tol biopolymer transport system component